MPRPRKWRRVCAAPRCTRFSPGEPDNGAVSMTVDEYESIRLIDWEGFTQERCADQMAVSRATAQAIYQEARRKLADCIVNSRSLVIGGGEYRICEHGEGPCGHGCCRRNLNNAKEVD